MLGSAETKTSKETYQTLSPPTEVKRGRGWLRETKIKEGYNCFQFSTCKFIHLFVDGHIDKETTGVVEERCRKFYSSLYSIVGAVKGVGRNPTVWTTQGRRK